MSVLTFGVFLGITFVQTLPPPDPPGNEIVVPHDGLFRITGTVAQSSTPTNGVVVAPVATPGHIPGHKVAVLG